MIANKIVPYCPSRNIPHELTFYGVKDDCEGLRFILADGSTKQPFLFVYFETHIAYKKINLFHHGESFDLNTNAGSFYIVQKSSWVHQLLPDDSTGSTDCFVHFVILTTPVRFDIIAKGMPTLKWSDDD